MAIVALAALLGWIGWTRLAGRARPNVLLVTIDTLRWDRLGCYGRAGGITPNLDRLAARGVRFETAVAHVPLTAPSHASILTGLTPPRHGVHDNGDFVLPAEVPTVAEAFSAAGYATAAFISGFPLDRRFGLGRGFALYDDRLPRGTDRRRAAYVERPADQTTAAVLGWLETAREPWFLWIHYFDPHSPYEPPPAFAERFPGQPYDGEVAFVDAELGRVLDRLGLRSGGTQVLVTADHGESLGEHGEDTHGVFVYDATLRVPLLMAGPGLPRGRTSPVVARSIDVTPTLLDLAGVAPHVELEGRSLCAAARGRAEADAPAYLESEFARRQLGWASLRGWRTARWKLIDAPLPELYALDLDPGETQSRLAEQATLAASLKQSLDTESSVKGPQATRQADAETAERLRALGYLGTANSVSAMAGSPRRDPKDGITLLRRIERGVAEARTDPELAIRELSAVIQEDPQTPLGWRYRAIAQAERQDFAAAAKDLRTLVGRGQATGDDLVLLGECLLRQKRPSDALEALDRAQVLLHDSPEALLGRARALRSLGRDDEAVSAYKHILDRRPDHPEALRALADMALAKGDLVQAGDLYQRIRQSDPGDVGAQVKLGVLAVRTGRMDEAIELFRRAVEREPGNAEALLDLGGALAKSGRAAEAVPYLERAVQAGPRTPVALNSLGFARLEAGDTAGGLQALRASLALDPRQPRVAEAVSQIAAERR